MKISIFGLGYVGCVGLGCFAKMGHHTTGVDISSHKVDLINSGKPTIIENEIDKLIASGFESGLITATQDYKKAVLETDISFICVPTPNTQTGHLDLNYIYKVSNEIAQGIKDKKAFHVVVIRSTVLPGTNQKVKQIIEEVSGKECGKGFCVVSNPEFLREGNAVDDFFNPGITVIGSDNQTGIELLMRLYEGITGKKVIVKIEVAEVIKLLNNTFHALKVAFGNEIGSICKALGVDTFELFDLFLADTKLNISPAYLKPGFAYGGSCLPKDLKALNLLSYDAYLNNPILSSIEKSNQEQIDRLVRQVEAKGKKNVGVLGISFKDGTDDLRNSPIIEVIERLKGRGYNIKIFDKNVNLSLLIGANKIYIQEKIPHLSEYFITEFSAFIKHLDVVIINGQVQESDIQSLLNETNVKIVDIKRVPQLSAHPGYEGFNW
jgi:GDP-mannose 6-dehydrogenase